MTEIVAEAEKSVEAVAQKAEAEVAKVETEVKEEVKAAEGVAADAVKDVKEELGKVEEKVVKFATEARIAVTADENLILTKMENTFLKGQMEMRRLQDEAKAIQEQYPKFVESLTKKYLIDPATHVFNAIEGAFVKR